MSLSLSKICGASLLQTNFVTSAHMTSLHICVYTHDTSADGEKHPQISVFKAIQEVIDQFLIFPGKKKNKHESIQLLMHQQ